jgi:hypothetical protein
VRGWARTQVLPRNREGCISWRTRPPTASTSRARSPRRLPGTWSRSGRRRSSRLRYTAASPYRTRPHRRFPCRVSIGRATAERCRHRRPWLVGHPPQSRPFRRRRGPRPLPRRGRCPALPDRTDPLVRNRPGRLIRHGLSRRIGRIPPRAMRMWTSRSWAAVTGSGRRQAPTPAPQSPRNDSPTIRRFRHAAAHRTVSRRAGMSTGRVPSHPSRHGPLPRHRHRPVRVRSLPSRRGRLLRPLRRRRRAPHRGRQNLALCRAAMHPAAARPGGARTSPPSHGRWLPHPVQHRPRPARPPTRPVQQHRHAARPSIRHRPARLRRRCRRMRPLGRSSAQEPHPLDRNRPDRTRRPSIPEPRSRSRRRRPARTSRNRGRGTALRPLRSSHGDGWRSRPSRSRRWVRAPS